MVHYVLDRVVLKVVIMSQISDLASLKTFCLGLSEKLTSSKDARAKIIAHLHIRQLKNPTLSRKRNCPSSGFHISYRPWIYGLQLQSDMDSLTSSFQALIIVFRAFPLQTPSYRNIANGYTAVEVIPL